jgi:hypothetical protein
MMRVRPIPAPASLHPLYCTHFAAHQPDILSLTRYKVHAADSTDSTLLIMQYVPGDTHLRIDPISSARDADRFKQFDILTQEFKTQFFISN